eukprot:PhM_4_TR4092/c0_g1_i1/m.90517
MAFCVNDVTLLYCEYLPANSVLALSRARKHLHELITDDDALWDDMCQRDYPTRDLIQPTQSALAPQNGLARYRHRADVTLRDLLTYEQTLVKTRSLLEIRRKNLCWSDHAFNVTANDNYTDVRRVILNSYDRHTCRLIAARHAVYTPCAGVVIGALAWWYDVLPAVHAPSQGMKLLVAAYVTASAVNALKVRYNRGAFYGRRPSGARAACDLGLAATLQVLGAVLQYVVRARLMPVWYTLTLTAVESCVHNLVYVGLGAMWVEKRHRVFVLPVLAVIFAKPDVVAYLAYPSQVIGLGIAANMAHSMWRGILQVDAVTIACLASVCMACSPEPLQALLRECVFLQYAVMAVPHILGQGNMHGHMRIETLLCTPTTVGNAFVRGNQTLLGMASAALDMAVLGLVDWSCGSAASLALSASVAALQSLIRFI